MRTYPYIPSWLHLPLISAALLLYFPTASAQDCSVDAWSGFDGVPLALGEYTTPVGKKYEQDCGLTIDATLVPAYVETDAPDNEGLFTARFYFLTSEIIISSGDVTIFRALDLNRDPEVELRLRSSGLVKYLVAFYWHDGGLVEHPNPIPLQDVWNAVEISWSISSGLPGDGGFSLKLNDLAKYALSDIGNASPETINFIQLGITNAASATGELMFDAFDLRRTAEVGLLTVNQLKNISTRADAHTGDEIVIGGFIITGDTDKCVVIRGRGQSVNVPAESRLADPKIELWSGQTQLMSNDNWEDLDEAQLIVDLGLAPAASSDAALYTCLPPGPYTAFLYSVDETSGIGIIEVNDADVGSPYLGNIATRALVGTGDLVTIAGFIIEGDQSKQILIRGRGQSVGVAPEARLSDSYLALHDQNGLRETNDDWADTNQEEIEATGLAPADASDAAILITLTPGPYTAILSGVGGATGIGIVEVLDISGGIIAAQ
jgi:hypothetical protein